MRRTIVDWLGNIVAFVILLGMNILANLLPLAGRTTASISDQYPSLFTPVGFTFSIWGLIYLTLALFVIYQALPGQRNNELIATISPWFKANCLANAAWLLFWHNELLWLALFVMVVILLTLIRIYQVLLRGQFVFLTPFYCLVKFPFSLYLGWIIVATIANISVLQSSLGWNEIGLTAVSWTFVKLALACTIGAILALRLSDPVVSLVVSWAAFGISVMHEGDSAAVAGAAVTVCLIAMLVAIVSIFYKLISAPDAAESEYRG